MKKEKFINICFLAAFFLILFVPLLKSDFAGGKVSKSENRIYAKQAKLRDENGKINKNFIGDFEAWINDNIGFREKFYKTNAVIQWKIFEQIDKEGYYIGKNGDYVFASDAMISRFQGKDLLDDEKVDEIISAYVTVNDWLEEKHIQFYYMQCYDKISIYPEQIMRGVKYSDYNSTQQIMNAMKQTDINVVDTKQAMLDAKNSYEVYGTWYDPVHWTPRGARIGYNCLMSSINANNNNMYDILTDEDYSINTYDGGSYLFGCNRIHKKDMIENFTIKNRKSENVRDKLLDNPAASDHYFVNDIVDNDTKVLIVGGSYIYAYIRADIAESFKETVLLGADDNIKKLPELVERFSPDIVIFENAEYVTINRHGYVVELAKRLNQ